MRPSFAISLCLLGAVGLAVGGYTVGRLTTRESISQRATQTSFDVRYTYGADPAEFQTCLKTGGIVTTLDGRVQESGAKFLDTDACTVKAVRTSDLGLGI